MIQVFFGDDRTAATNEIKKQLGENYEVIDAAELSADALPDIFFGTTLFADERKILIKDLFSNTDLLNAFGNYLDTPHQVIILESALDRRKAAIKDLEKDPRLKFQKFEKAVSSADRFFVFNIYDQALTNPAAAVKALRAREAEQEPYACLGAWTKKALDNLAKNEKSAKNRRIVKELAKIDLALKTTKLSNNPWPVLESFLLRIKTL